MVHADDGRSRGLETVYMGQEEFVFGLTVALTDNDEIYLSGECGVIEAAVPFGNINAFLQALSPALYWRLLMPNRVPKQAQTTAEVFATSSA